MEEKPSHEFAIASDFLASLVLEANGGSSASASTFPCFTQKTLAIKSLIQKISRLRNAGLLGLPEPIITTVVYEDAKRLELSGEEGYEQLESVLQELESLGVEICRGESIVGESLENDDIRPAEADSAYLSSRPLLALFPAHYRRLRQGITVWSWQDLEQIIIAAETRNRPLGNLNPIFSPGHDKSELAPKGETSSTQPGFVRAANVSPIAKSTQFGRLTSPWTAFAGALIALVLLLLRSNRVNSKSELPDDGIEPVTLVVNRSDAIAPHLIPPSDDSDDPPLPPSGGRTRPVQPKPSGGAGSVVVVNLPHTGSPTVDTTSLEPDTPADLAQFLKAIAHPSSNQGLQRRIIHLNNANPEITNQQANELPATLLGSTILQNAAPHESFPIQSAISDPFSSTTFRTIFSQTNNWEVNLIPSHLADNGNQSTVVPIPDPVTNAQPQTKPTSNDLPNNPSTQSGENSLTLNAGGGNQIIPVSAIGGTITINYFNGVGPGINRERSENANTLYFSEPGCTVENLFLTQTGDNLEITFDGVQNIKVILTNFVLQDLDNLPLPNGPSSRFGNIQFAGDSSVLDNFDVFDAIWESGGDGMNNDGIYYNRVLGTNKVTFLNKWDNNVKGFDNSNDVINGQGGNDILYGLGGDDILRGGTGNDQLWGGCGNNTLTGNEGNDLFVLDLNGFSRVTDFTPGQDAIGLPDGVTPNDLTIEQGTGLNSSSTWVSYRNQPLLELQNVRANQLTADAFMPLTAYGTGLNRLS